MTTTAARRPDAAVRVDLAAGITLAVASTVVVIGVLSRFDALAALDTICSGGSPVGPPCDDALVGGSLLAGRLTAIAAWTLGIAGIVAQAVRHRLVWPWPLLAILIGLGALWAVTAILEGTLLP